MLHIFTSVWVLHMLNAGWNMLFQRFHVYRNVFARFLWKNEAKEREKSNFGELPRAISTWKLVLIYNSWTFWEQLCLFIIIYIVSKCANNYVFRKWKCKVFFAFIQHPKRNNFIWSEFTLFCSLPVSSLGAMTSVCYLLGVYFEYCKV